MDESGVLHCSAVGCPVCPSRDPFVEYGRDPVVRLARVHESKGFPTANDFLLDPFVGLSEVIINSLIDNLTQTVKRWFRVRSQEVVEREIKGVGDKKHDLVIL